MEHSHLSSFLALAYNIYSGIPTSLSLFTPSYAISHSSFAILYHLVWAIAFSEFLKVILINRMLALPPWILVRIFHIME